MSNRLGLSAGAAALAWRHWRDVEPRDWPLEFFAPAELASKGDGSLKLVLSAGLALDELRRRLGEPVVLTSAYRDELHNARVGGAPLSRHKWGDAFDIRLAGLDRWRVLAIARAVGFTGIGYARSFLHVDGGPPREWDYGKGSRATWKR